MSRATRHKLSATLVCPYPLYRRRALGSVSTVVVPTANYALTVGGAWVAMAHSGNVYTALCTGGAVKEYEFVMALSSGAVFPAGTSITATVWSGPNGGGTQTLTLLSGFSPAGQATVRLNAPLWPITPTDPLWRFHAYRDPGAQRWHVDLHINV